MDEIEEIKQRIDIADLVGQYVALKKAGANYKGLCPFHHERSPSFMVNPERQIFKCFGCQKGGDIFTFIQETEHIEFGDALRMLAEQANVTLKPRSQPKPGQAPSEKSQYYQINKFATQVFHQLLTQHPVGKEAREYLKKRHITDATIKEWQIGYAPRKKILAEFLLKKGFTKQEIELAGKPDMFYERIIFPIFDIMGNVVGFTGRILGQGEPKYLNTPETPIFHKSRILFGLEKAKKAIKETGQVILSEGQMDVIGAHQAGTQNVVATSGTALTQDHLRILSRYEVNIVFAFDADSAGHAATKKAIDMAAADQLPIKIIPIPAPHKDIGDIVEKNPALWLELAKAPVPAIQWQIETTLARYMHKGIERKLSIDEKKQVAKELVPVFVRIADPIEQSHYVQLLAKRLDVKEDTIIQSMNKMKGIGPTTGALGSPTGAILERRQLSTEEALLGLLEITPTVKGTHPDLYNELKEWYNKPVNDLLFLVQEQYRGLSPAEITAEIELLIRRHTEQKQDRLKADFAKRISDAEQSGNREQVKTLLSEFQRLIKPKQ